MLVTTVADQQFVAGAAASLSWQPTDSDGEPADPGTVTVGVTRSDGSEVIAAGTATTGEAKAERQVSLGVAQTATIDHLTATWSVGATVVAVTVAEVIGRPLLTQAEYRAREQKAPQMLAVDFVRARREVDDLFRRETHRGLTPRFAVERVEVRNHRRVLLRFPDLRSVRWAVEIDDNGTRTALTSQQLDSIGPSASGIAELRDGYLTCGRTLEIGYEHGYDRAPYDVVGAAARYLRYVTSSGASGIPDRATTFADGSGGTTQLATPGLGPFITGIPEVDEVIVAHSWTQPGMA